MRRKGFFITFEGTDGVGKSTQLQLTQEWLKKRRENTVLTREPGGGKISEKIRKILLDPAHEIEGLTELFLYQAARVEHVEKVIKPALKKNQIVLCDRFTDSTLAYQGVGRNLMKSAVALNNIATSGIKPDLTILLTLPPEIGLEKARKRSKRGDRLENEGLAFQKKVQKAFLQIAKRESMRIKVVSVQEQKSATQAIIRRHIAAKLYGNLRAI